MTGACCFATMKALPRIRSRRYEGFARRFRPVHGCRMQEARTGLLPPIRLSPTRCGWHSRRMRSCCVWASPRISKVRRCGSRSRDSRGAIARLSICRRRRSGCSSGLLRSAKPTVLVLMSGSAVAVNWAQEHVPAIIEAWYGGQAAGSALADVLFGDYNPAGRLPVTFYKSVNDLPAFDDYRMAGGGRTYRFFKGTPLYPFGYGLSYTTFAYKSLRTSATTLRGGAADTLTVRVDVTNTGHRIGDEVAQLYVRHLGSRVERPNEDLRGYRRITLKPGETRTVEFSLPAASLAYWNSDLH